MANPTTVWRLDDPLCSGLRYVNNNIIFPGDIKAKGGQKSLKSLQRIRKENDQSGKEEWKDMFLIQCLGRKQSTLMSATSLPSQFHFEVSRNR